MTFGPSPAGPFSRAVSAGGFIYVSAMAAVDDTGAVVAEGDAGGQTRWILTRMRDLLAAAGSSLDQVVAATVYLRSASDFQTMNSAYRPFWPADPPTRTTVIAGLVPAGALVEIAAIAVPSGAERVVVHPDGWARSPNPYSYAIRTGDTVFLSGLVPRRGRDNSAVAGDIRVQTQTVLDNAAELLGAAGLSTADIVASRVYLTDPAQFSGMNETYRGHFPRGFPARATVTCGLAGPDFMVEMTFTASTASRRVIGQPPSGVPISPAVRSGRRLYLSGMLGNTPQAGGDVRAQTRETLSRIQATLAAAGASPDDVVESVVYLKEPVLSEGVDDVYRSFFRQAFPARTIVGAPLVVEDGLVEIMVTAVAPEGA